ncbi:MAG: hypothetical protein DRI56_04685 [Chloroflexota bacterium]|nr:MAG: hypothetical protein DRI56_04685 [Chloroflexota bacterium]
MPKFPPLPITSPWVEKKLSQLTLDQKIGQLLHPNFFPTTNPEELAEALGDVEPGGVFLHPGTGEAFQATIQWLQERAFIPIIISSDLENGAGRIIEGATTFPELMSLAATDNEQYAYEMGRASALEGRAFGVHWAFGPVVDINAHPHSPGSNARTLGDSPERVSRLSQAIIQGMQDHGLCATAKHFPGSGFDDRDPHLCTTINPLRMDEWFRLSGRMFQDAINMGVWSIMIGHTSLPAWDAGDGSHIQTAPPAPISRRLITDLLRERMGFDGLIITDAMDMAGVTAWGTFDQIIPKTIEVGCDMILFADMKRDFAFVKQAVEDGRLSEERIDESVRRVLALKVLLGLDDGALQPPSDLPQSEPFQRLSRAIAEDAITVVKDENEILPLKLEEGTRVLSYHLRGDPELNVDTFDDMLRERGVEVTRATESAENNPHPSEFDKFDVILFQAVMAPSWGTNRIRLAGNYMRYVWRFITAHHPRLVFVSYGSPYHTYDMPNLPTVINAYSPDTSTQKAVLRVLTGEIKAKGHSPVDLEAPYRFKNHLL